MTDQGTTITDRLLTRTIIACQAEQGLSALDIAALHEFLERVNKQLSEPLFPRTQETLTSDLARLQKLGYVDLDLSNPHVSVGFQGYLACAPVGIPPELQDTLAAYCSEVDLR